MVVLATDYYAYGGMLPERNQEFVLMPDSIYDVYDTSHPCVLSQNFDPSLSGWNVSDSEVHLYYDGGSMRVRTWNVWQGPYITFNTVPGVNYTVRLYMRYGSDYVYAMEVKDSINTSFLNWQYINKGSAMPLTLTFTATQSIAHFRLDKVATHLFSDTVYVDSLFICTTDEMIDTITHRVGTGYVFGYGGHLKDNEIAGEGNYIDMGDRHLDTRLGRTPKVDAKASKYPDVSPYSYAANNPIFFIDPNGKEVKAYSAASQDLVIKTLNYAFGKEHGFSFENNKLVHSGESPKNLTPQQTLMFSYFNETLVKSTTPTEVNANTNSSARVNASGELQIGGITKDGNATTYFYPGSKKYSESEPGYLPMILNSVPNTNDIVVTPGLMQNGISLETEKGTSNFSVEHATLHEFAHGMMNTIMNEFGGNFNGVNFNEMSPQAKQDWAIQFTNTLLQSQGKPLETGTGQHKRKESEKPDKSSVAPLTK